MQLTIAQKKEFFDNGYIQLRGMIPPEMINMSIRTINHSWERNGCAQMPGVSSRLLSGIAKPSQ
jgi:hypothetical protein